DGISQETDIPIQWSQTENVKWRLPLPGEAASTPVIWEDKIFLTSAEGDALVLMCISTEGKELWKRTLGHGNRDVRGGEGNSAAPSPVTDGEHVWAFIGTGDLACYDFEGNQVWHTNLAERYGSFNLYFVMSTTPLLDKDRLYFQLIHSNAWVVLALDKMTGEEIWKHNRDSDATEECEQAYTSPIIYRDAQREYLVVHGADYVTAHSLEDGSEIWRCGGLNPKESYNYSLRFVASPVAMEGLIVVPSAKNGPVLGIDPSAAPGDITDSKWQLWKLPQGTPDVPSPVIHDGLVYLCRERGDLICLDAETGEQLYRERTHRHRHRASPVYANGHIYLTSRDGIVNVVKTGRKFEIVASNSIEEVIAASPAIANGTLYLRSYQALYAIGTEE
ncbi:PQQ-binding-like beta-propeller repeat protein, partial [Candidatus Poribacteria bacterium]|nr:PQQ-binding-like beta-propeller repeat protein [Candidatus Poribacteria bacterium]